MIPFNKPYMTGLEPEYMQQAVDAGKISGDGMFTRRCQQFFQQEYGFGQCLLTTSCTDALEMAALLLRIQPGDEVIAPSFTFVSTVNAFVLRGARIVFVDSTVQSPNMDVTTIEAAISPKTKAIVVVHYAGMAVDMDTVMAVAAMHGIAVVEDAAQCIHSFYKGRPLGSFGALSAFSFHETKNISCGEGGMLCINDEALYRRAEIIREKGTNRSAFFRGEVDKYSWVDVGSSFLPGDLTAAFLWAQLQQLQAIQQHRMALWEVYYHALAPLQAAGKVQLPHLPPFATNNGHMFYMVCPHADLRTRLISHLKSEGIQAIFHYQALHQSSYYLQNHSPQRLPLAEHYSLCLLRLPLFYQLTVQQASAIAGKVLLFFETE